MRFNHFVSQKPLNHEGEECFLLSPEMELYTAVVTTALSDKFYESSMERLERISSLVSKVDPLFVAQLAVYARTKMNLRSVPMFLLVELARVHKGDDLVRRAVEGSVLRADEICELLTCYQWRNNPNGAYSEETGATPKKLNRLSHQLQAGLQDAFNRFDEYQFAKYDREGEVALRDALFLVHPKAKNNAQQAIFDKIASKTLETPYTWEVEFSRIGEQYNEPFTLFSAKLSELIDSYKETQPHFYEMMKARKGKMLKELSCMKEQAMKDGTSVSTEDLNELLLSGLQRIVFAPAYRNHNVKNNYHVMRYIVKSERNACNTDLRIKLRELIESKKIDAEIDDAPAMDQRIEHEYDNPPLREELCAQIKELIVSCQPFGTLDSYRDAFRAKWEELIDSGKLGYMATLRNLRNMLGLGVSERHISKVCALIADPREVARSRQMPFRFLAAWREIKEVGSIYTQKVMDALEEAVCHSAASLKGFGEDTNVVVACDVSGSMQSPVSAMSSVRKYDIGLLLGMLLKSKCKNVISGMFGDIWKTIALPSKGILSNVDEFYNREGEVGYSTNGYLVLKDLADRQVMVDKVMMFTDCQMWNSYYWHSDDEESAMRKEWARYKAMNPKAKLYLFDLAGYGNTPLDIKENDVYLIAGWSDKVFDVLEAIENGGDALEVIRKTEL